MSLEPEMIAALTEIQGDLFGEARRFRESGSEVQPTAFFIGSQGIEIMPLKLDKPMWRAAILLGILRFRAVAVILHTEAWAVIGPEGVAAAAARKSGSISSLMEFAGRKEILRSSMEMIDGTLRDLHAEIAEGKLGATEVLAYPKDSQRTGNLTGFYAALTETNIGEPNDN